MAKKKNNKFEKSIKDDKDPKSRARKIRMLLKKNHSVFKDKEALTEFREPVLFLRRRSGATEIHEDASKGSFVFKHSDGYEREIYLDPSTQGTMDYGKRKFKYYWCHEDFPLPLPENPRLTADTVNSIVEKTSLDMKRLNLRKQEMTLKTWKIIGWFILGAILLLILWKTHVFERVIGLVTGNPYVDPSTIQGGATNLQNSGQNGNGVIDAIKQSSLAIDSGGGG